MASKNIDANILQESYTAKDLAVLEGLDAVRKRPGMYIGSTDSRGLMHCLWEIIDNSVDEALAGHCKKIEINLESDGSVEVHDDGRGIPVDKEPKTGLTGVEVVLQNYTQAENSVAAHMPHPVVCTASVHQLLTHLQFA